MAVVPVFPSVTVAPPMETRGSSSTMTPTAWPESLGAPGELVRLREKYSSDSPSRSPLIAMATVLTVWPGAKVSVPEAAWKSLPDVAAGGGWYQPQFHHSVSPSAVE